MKLDKFGREVIDAVKSALPVKFKQPTEAERLHRLVAGILSQQNQKMGFETYDESIDFDVDDDPFPQSAHELGAFDEYQLDQFERLVRSGHFDQEVPAQPSNAPISGETGGSNHATSGNADAPLPAGGNPPNSGT